MHDQMFFDAYTQERVSASRRTLRPLAVVAIRVVPERSNSDHHFALGADPAADAVPLDDREHLIAAAATKPTIAKWKQSQLPVSSGARAHAIRGTP